MTITFNDEFKDPMYRELDDRITELEEEKMMKMKMTETL